MFFGLLGNSTPRYQGLGTSPARKSGGVLGFLSGLLGGTGSPTYVGAGQPVRNSGFGLRLFGANPTYMQPPVEPATMPVASAAVESGDKPEAKRTTVTIIVESDSDAPEAGELQTLQDRVLDD